MMRAFERREQRVRGTTEAVMRESKFVIWCYESAKMPAMIDLLIAQGSLSEADRPHCVHWTTVKGRETQSPEEIAKKMVDADEMLAGAGIRTLMAEGFEAYTQSADALKAFWRDRFGELDAGNLEMLEQLEREAQKTGIRKWGPATLAQPEASGTAPVG
jgi:hypothetical protein